MAIKFNTCKDCGVSSAYHTQTWIDACIVNILPSFSFPQKFLQLFDALLEKILLITGMGKMQKDIDLNHIQMRTACFIEEANKKGIVVECLMGPYGSTNQYCAQFAGKTVRFESLPLAKHVSKAEFDSECKQGTRDYLKKGDFPVAKGNKFFISQYKQALQYGDQILGYPLVVKPRRGSVARHVTTDIQTIDEFRNAIKKALQYSPNFVVERYIENANVYRATVIDFSFVSCVKQVPAHVVGDGRRTIRELVDEKNKEREKDDRINQLLHPLVVNDATTELLKLRGYTFSSIPQEGAIVCIQKDPFLKLGGDLVEVTDSIHPDNHRLFQEISEYSLMRVVGIDICIPDVTRSWKNQHCAILELNSTPCIELHHYPSSGAPQNVAGAVVDLMLKYY